MTTGSGPRVGRRPSTTGDHITHVALELFATRGFGEVSVDDVAKAAGIARRTLFRYYPSKNAIPWGDFDAHLQHLRDLLAGLSTEITLSQALREALLSFNSYDDHELAQHRQRMRVILESEELQAYSMTMYAGWRKVIAEYVAHRIGTDAAGLMPQTVGWLMLGVALSAYEHWLADESVSLSSAIAQAFEVTRPGLESLT